MDTDTLVELYDLACNFSDYRDNGNIIYRLDELFGEYDPEGTLLIPEVFNMMSPEHQEAVIDLARQIYAPLNPGDPGYARQLYEDATSGYMDDEDAHAILMFYNALKDEGFVDFD